MRIHRLELDGFRSYRRAGVLLDAPVTFVIGRNAGGKSTTIDALQWALTGRCRGTDARGVGSDTLIRQGEGTMRVGLQIEDVDGRVITIERGQTAKGSSLTVDDVGGSKEAQMGALFGRLGVTPAIVDACLQSDVFLALHHADAKNLLLDVLDVRISLTGADGERFTLNQIETKYKHWFEERRKRKAALQAIVIPPAPDGEIPNVDAIAAQLSALREQEKRLLSAAAAASGEATGRRGELEKQLAHVHGASARTQAAFEGSATTAALDGARVDLADALMEIDERLSMVADDEADEAADLFRVQLVDDQGRLKMLTDAHQAIADHSPERGCVLNGSIPCKTPVKAFAAEVEKLQGQIDALNVARDEATKAVEKARLRAAQVDQLTKRRAELQRIAAGRAAQAQDLEDFTRTEQSLRKELAACAAPTEPSAELVTLQQRIAKGDTVLRTARDVVAAAELNQTRKSAATEASKSLAEAEAWVEQLGPNGLRVEALSQALERFTLDINGSLERFGYQLQFIADPWSVLVNGLPASLLSASERLRVGIALQLALAEATGFHFVAIDAVDMLDAGNRALLGEVLSLRGRVQVLAAATKDEGWDPPSITGWAWYRVTKAGGVSQVERCGEAVPA